MLRRRRALASQWGSFKKWASATKKRLTALAYFKTFALYSKCILWCQRHLKWIGFGVFIVAIASTAAVLWLSGTHLQSYFGEPDRLPTLRSLLQGLGGALLGATAIVSSLVLFAMQVNVDRMPYGLFRRLSSDGKLLSSFAVAFILALLVVVLSTIPDKSWAAIAVGIASWATLGILLLFLYAYRRALDLISPIAQVSFLRESAMRDLALWARRAERARPLFESNSATNPPGGIPRDTHDDGLRHFFQVNTHWTAHSKDALKNLVAIARRYAERGDYDIAGVALSAVVEINNQYVTSKGKTFYTHLGFIEDPRTADHFVSETLELVRQYTQGIATKRDEQLIGQSLRLYAQLARVYLTIDYSRRGASKTHAALAIGYLGQEIEGLLPHGMPDIAMEGARLLGQVGHLFVQVGDVEQLRTITEKLRNVGLVGVAKENHRPVTITAVEQLADLTFILLRSEAPETRFVLEDIRKQIELLGSMLLELAPGSSLSSPHSTCLAPYYSGTSLTSLRYKLTVLTNHILDQAKDSARAKTMIENVEHWSDKIYATEKELLLLAIAKRSQLTFDLLHWIEDVTELLLAIASAPACEQHTRAELERHADWLASVLSWVPDDEESVRFLERFRISERMFSIAMSARKWNSAMVEGTARRLLLEWAFKGGKHRTGWGTMQQTLYAVVVLVLLDSTEVGRERLRVQLTQHLTKAGVPDLEMREAAAAWLIEKSDNVHSRDFALSPIEAVVEGIDEARLRATLREIASMIAPNSEEQ